MLFYVTFTVLLVSAQAKFYKDCGSKLATIHSVGVSGCAEDAKECILKRNSNVSITVDFTPTQELDEITTVVHGIIMNLPVPFPLPQPDACKDNGLTCPIKAGVVANYKTSLPVLKSYPKVSVEVKWELRSKDEEDLICLIIPARIN